MHVRPTQGKVALLQALCPDEALAGTGSDLPPWITLRTSFNKLIVEDGDAGQHADPDGFFKFAVEDLEDELIKLVAELTANLRTSKTLAEVPYLLFLVAMTVYTALVRAYAH